MEDKLNKECSEGRISGPHDMVPFINFKISPIGLQPKKIQGQFRVIHHLSHPLGQSVNDSIPKEFSSVKYASVAQVIGHITRMGKGCFLAKS